MKKLIVFLLSLLMAVSLFATPYILAIPTQHIINQFKAISTYESMRQLAQNNYQILHYDNEYAIII